MKCILKIALATFMAITMAGAHATLVNYTITGDVLSGNESFPNAFGLTAGNTITATGTFDDSVIPGGTGTVMFGSGSGNTMTINVGTATFTAGNDVDFASGDPYFTLASYALTDFDYLAFAGTNGASDDFSSYLTIFDDLDSLVGQWRTTISIQPVPVPAAVWLFGSGLLGLAGIARRKRNRI